MNQKYRDADDRAVKFETDLIAARKELTETQKKLEGMEIEDEWVQDMVHTSEKPVYNNPHSKQVITLPCSLDEFKKTYTYEKTEEGNRIYKKGEEFVKIPETLAMALSKPMGAVEISKSKKAAQINTDIKLTKDDLELAEILDSSEEPLTKKEILKDWGKPNKEKHIEDRNLYRLKETGRAIEVVEDGKKKYWHT